MSREDRLTPVSAAIQSIIQRGQPPAAPQVGLAHQGLAVIGGLSAGAGRQPLGAA